MHFILSKFEFFILSSFSWLSGFLSGISSDFFVIVNAFIVPSPFGRFELTCDNFPKSYHLQLSISLPDAKKHFPLSTFTESNAETPSTLDSNSKFILFLVPWTSIITAKLFAFIFKGFANSNVWYPASTVFVSPVFSSINCISFLSFSVPFGFTYTLHIYVSGAYKATWVKYSSAVVFLLKTLHNIIFELLNSTYVAGKYSSYWYIFSYSFLSVAFTIPQIILDILQSSYETYIYSLIFPHEFLTIQAPFFDGLALSKKFSTL